MCIFFPLQQQEASPGAILPTSSTHLLVPPLLVEERPQSGERRGVARLPRLLVVFDGAPFVPPLHAVRPCLVYRSKTSS